MNDPSGSTPGAQDRNYSRVQYGEPEREVGRKSVDQLRDKREPRSRLAVIVAHGMGQQVPFETIDGLARGLRREDAQQRGKTAQELPSVTVGFLKQGEQTLPRAEVEIGGVAVDLFEVYWAPVTQGKVLLRDVVQFLLDAGWRGLGNAGPRGIFERWMFGKWQQLPLNGLATRLFFLLALFVFAALLAINAVTAVVATAGVFSPSHPAWLTPTLKQELTTALSVPALVGAGLVLGYGVHGWLPRRLAHALLRLLVNATLASILLAGAVVGLLIACKAQQEPRIHFLGSLPAHPAYQGTLWILIALLSAAARWFILEYVGDVAAYISAHTVNRYSEIRKEIQEIALKTGKAVYSARGVDKEPLYDRVVVVGHSLGSVVAYDMLNALIRADLLSDGVGERVAERTPLFLTFGSPLDKTAYIFRTQQPRDAEVREALAAAIQPMIASYEHRPRHWINLWSPDDWISGELNFYDERKGESPKRVMNRIDPDAFLPGAAHNQYWGNPLLRAVLYQALVKPEFNPDEIPWPKK